MKVKANKKLFDEIHEILDKMKCHLLSIVQTDRDIYIPKEGTVKL